MPPVDSPLLLAVLCKAKQSLVWRSCRVARRCQDARMEQFDTLLKQLVHPILEHPQPMFLPLTDQVPHPCKTRGLAGRSSDIRYEYAEPLMTHPNIRLKQSDNYMGCQVFTAVVITFLSCHQPRYRKPPFATY